MNSWNGSTSYACNLKITHLGLMPEEVDKLFDMIQTQEFFDAMDKWKWEFAAKHNYPLAGWDERPKRRLSGPLSG